jgi:hypothetical protein
MSLIPYFECQYPQVAALTSGQAASIVNSGGMGDYLPNFNWPIPQYLKPGNIRGLGDYLTNFAWPIPQYLKPGNIRGLGCCGCDRGLGQGTITIGGATISLSAPDGYFSTGDMSQWGLEEWATVGAGVYLLLSLWDDTKRHVRKTRKAAKAYRSAS